MKALSQLFLTLIVLLSLAACGGGGGGNGSSGGAFNGGTYALTISPGATTLAQNSQTTVTVGVKNPDGTTVSNGLAVSLSVTPVDVGTVGTAAGSTSNTATGSTSGGSASFIFLSAGKGGTAHLVASVQNTNGTTSTTSTDITVSATSVNDPRLQLSASTTTLPLNPFNPEDGSQGFPGNYLGSPYIAEVTLQWRHSNGQLVGGTLKANVSMSNVTVAGFSTLDDPTTPWDGATKTPPTVAGNEFLTILGSGQVNVTAGIGTLFVHSFNTPGTSVLTITATDPDTNQAISSQITITVAGGASNVLPGGVTISQAPGGVYVSGGNGPQSKIISATVTDGNGALVKDATGFDNVQFQIIGPTGTDAKLTGINAAGQSQTGSTVVTTTHNGIASVSFQAGTQQGPVQIKATVDRGDNNVDNQIQDPISATATVVVSDGKLFSLTLTSPGGLAPSIAINRISSLVTLATQSSGTIPPDPNATYSFTVSVHATDRQGNPPPAGTVIRFGSIDAPQTNFFFDMAGVRGDPVEGGTGFSALDGNFITGGAGPGDTLIVIGKQSEGAPAGNDDLESAVKIASVNSQTSLTVGSPFNYNDTTGVKVDNGPVLPWVVGRATVGNITSPASTDVNGTASTKLNYPVSALGRVAAVYAQGNGTDTAQGSPGNGTTTTVTDAAFIAFPGVAPGKIIISPNPIPGNITLPVTVCFYDALGSPLPGAAFTFAFANLGVGSGTVDGVSGSGSTSHVTDAGGCVVATVSTTGVASGGTGNSAPSLSFSVGTTTATAPITASGGLVLLALPSACPGTGCTVTLRLLNSNGSPVPGVQLTGKCTGDNSIGITSIGTTGSDGSTTATITAKLDQYKTPKSGSCDFTTSTGSPTTTVNLQGIDLCIADPGNAACGTTGGTGSTLTLTVKGGTGGGSVSVASNTGFSPPPAAGTTCTAAAGATQVCTYSVTSGSSVTLSPTPTTVVWSNTCSGSGSINVTVTAASTCTGTFP